MKRFSLCCQTVLLAAVWLSSHNAIGQEHPRPPAVRPEPSFYPADELLNRLEDAEARIRLLESQQSATASETATAIQPSTFFRSITLGELLGHDPEIGIVREMTAKPDSDIAKKKWYEKLSVRGYAQFRINEDFEEEDSAPAQLVGDRSVGDNQSFLIRRARLIISGDVHERLFVYLQPDFAVTTPGSADATHFAQIRDWYGDVYLSTDKVHRLRVGQSKIPYGWENMQSSSNRIPLDRNDALNSAARNERDLGVFYYYTPTWAQDFFKEVLEKGLKGSGNYGMFGIGVYNGQGGSLLEQNDNLHAIVRLTYPLVLDSGQYAELAVQAYTGDFVVLSSPIRALGAGPAIRPKGTLETGDDDGFEDERVAATFVWYPQPFGIQCEWTVGRGPALNETQTAVEDEALYGGYVMCMYKIDNWHGGTWFPFVRWNYFKGGYKSERNAPFAEINEWELGVEWQINPAMELSLGYTLTERTNTSAMNQPGVVSYRQFDGSIVRLQFQLNY